MNEYVIDGYKLTVKEETDFDLHSDYSKNYDAVFIIEEPDLEDGWFHKIISIRVESESAIKNVLIMASYHTIVDKCAALAGEQLFMLLNDVMILFDPADLKITKQKELGLIMGTMIAVYSYKDDFIVHYEMDIMRIDRELNVKWDFGGSDIFVRWQSNDPAFVMKEDRICLYDFNEHYYEIDYDGNKICDIKSENE